MNKNHSGSPRPSFRLEKRSGREVTVIAGLHTYGEDRLRDVAKELKTLLGVGGTVKNGLIEIQGDNISVIRAWFKIH